MLLAGKIDFNMAGNMFAAFNNAQNDIPTVMVAAIFQKEPQILMAHPGAGNDSLEDLVGKPILISNDARLTFWEWLKATYGYTDDQIRPYTFNSAPFLADEQAIQQGYVTSEPFAIQREGGFEPVVHLLADSGYDSYSTMIEAPRSVVDDNPDLVQRFVDASIEGWYSYLYGDPAPANELIKADNPDMTDEQIAFSIETLKSYGIVDSGDSETMGIGAMTEDRWSGFLQFAKDAGIYPDDLDIGATYSLDFVNQEGWHRHESRIAQPAVSRPSLAGSAAKKLETCSWRTLDNSVSSSVNRESRRPFQPAKEDDDGDDQVL